MADSEFKEEKYDEKSSITYSDETTKLNRNHQTDLIAADAQLSDLTHAESKAIHQSLTQQSAYYRSYYFTSHTGSNSLIISAQALLMLQSRLLLLPSISSPDIAKQIEKLLQHELKAFQARAISLNCSQTEIAIARRLLTHTIIPSLPHHESLFLERKIQFSQILLHLIEHTYEYRSLIDLACIILSLGLLGESLEFNGQQRKITEIVHQLNPLKQDQTEMSPQNQNIQRSPFLTLHSDTVIPMLKRNFFNIKKMSFILGGLFIGALVILNLLLESIAGPLVNQLSTVLHVSIL